MYYAAHTQHYQQVLTSSRERKNNDPSLFFLFSAKNVRSIVRANEHVQLKKSAHAQSRKRSMRALIKSLHMKSKSKVVTNCWAPMVRFAAGRVEA